MRELRVRTEKCNYFSKISQYRILFFKQFFQTTRVQKFCFKRNKHLFATHQ